MTYDFVVIGAGVSGITSAITLAKIGYQVALVEKAAASTPLLRGFSRKGIQFDTGFHYTGGLGPGEPLEIFLNYLGVLNEITPFPFNEDGFDIFRSPSRQFEFRLPVGFEGIRERLTQTFPDERRAVEQYLEMVSAACNATPYLGMTTETESSNLLQRVIGPTLKEVLDSLTSNTLLKNILSMHTLLYGVSSDQVSFTQHAIVTGIYYKSVHGIQGGGLSLAQAFDKRVDQLGVDVRLNSCASRILVDSEGKLTGVHLESGEDIFCKACISTVHPKLLLDMVPESFFRPVYKKRLAMLEETVSAYIAYAGCSKPLPVLAGTNMFIVQGAGGLEKLGEKPVEQTPLYLSAAYREGDIEPAGFIGIFPAHFATTDNWKETQYGKRSDGYRVFKKEMLIRMQHHIEKVFPEAAGTIDYIEGSTPLTMRDFCNTPFGGLYGVKHMTGQYNPHPVTRIKGLFLAGQAVISPGIMGAIISGFLACGSILGHERLREDIKKCL